jgi:hypothetical protein
MFLNNGPPYSIFSKEQHGIAETKKKAIKCNRKLQFTLVTYTFAEKHEEQQPVV